MPTEDAPISSENNETQPVAGTISPETPKTPAEAPNTEPAKDETVSRAEMNKVIKERDKAKERNRELEAQALNNAMKKGEVDLIDLNDQGVAFNQGVVPQDAQIPQPQSQHPQNPVAPQSPIAQQGANPEDVKRFEVEKRLNELRQKEAELRASNQALQKDRLNARVDMLAMNEFNKAGGEKEFFKFFKANLVENHKFMDIDGETKIVKMKPTGEIEQTYDFKEFVESIKKVFPKGFKSKAPNQSGAGATPHHFIGAGGVQSTQASEVYTSVMPSKVRDWPD